MSGWLHRLPVVGTGATAGTVIGSAALGLLFGAAAGERAVALAPVGDAFLRLLTMTILPFVVVGIVRGLGSLSDQTALRLVRRGAAILGVLWALTMLYLAVLVASFPPEPPGGVFSHVALVEVAPVDHLSLFVPANVFAALVAAQVPAVVLFSALLGLAVAHTEDAEHLLRTLTVAERALAQVTRFALRVTPLGVFARCAATAGSVSWAEIDHLAPFLLLYISAALVALLWLVPVWVSALLPVGRGQLLRVSRDAIVLAAASGMHFVCIPLIARAVRLLYEEDDETVDELDVLVPVSLNLPQAGSVLDLSFVAFVSWAYAEPIGALDWAWLAAVGPLHLPAGPAATLSTLLVDLDLPLDGLHLYRSASVVLGFVRAPLDALSQVALAALYVGWCRGTLRRGPGPILRAAGWTAATAAALAGLLRLGFAALPEAPQPPSPAPPAQAPVADALDVPPASSGDRLQAIRARGVARVAVPDDQPPWAWQGPHGRLGLDVELATSWAGRQGVAVAFVPLRRGELAEDLASGEVDLALGGLSGLTPGVDAASEPYLLSPLVLLAPDPQVRLLLAHPRPRRFAVLDRGLLPIARAWGLDGEEQATDWAAYVAGRASPVLLTTREEAAAQAHRRPALGVAQVALGQVALVVALPPGEEALRASVDAWLVGLRDSGVVERWRDRWLEAR